MKKIKARSQQINFFQNDWLPDPAFKYKVWNNKENTKFRCWICTKSSKLSTTGCAALTDHGKGKKHKDAVKALEEFIQKAIQNLVALESEQVVGQYEVNKQRK